MATRRPTRPAKARGPRVLFRPGKFGRHGGRFGPSLVAPRPRRKRAKLLSSKCPRCDHRWSVPPRYGMAVCDCGWLLKIEPYHGGVVFDDVVRVAGDGIDTRLAVAIIVNGVRVNKVLFYEGARRIIENWYQRGKAKLEIDRISGRFGIKTPTGESVEDEAETRRWMAERAQHGSR